MQVISDLLEHRGEPGLLFNNPVVKPEMRREYVKAVRSWANFLKHAKDDPEGEIEFKPAINDYNLWHCLIGLNSLRVPMRSRAPALRPRAWLAEAGSRGIRE